ncbi:MAG: glycoside hydrolase family 78 protein [Faecalicatena sp.]|uniref:alpha-L-rhamnosidase n=1 Tax=Faecalicatena sp. TaxID=2005360 RepID=UPI002582DE47|nr:alpha-L-rhamnosidase [Faecalicatena sp.]MCI6464191.1 glycoside hydrolase family 78 protein [Faecalicatena sp.]MDY5621157.1 family 78 glycoside hydrolase catalytic domain [Lachnospiraceae bacterium]
MKLTQLRVNHIETPMGFQINPLSFSWKVEEADGAKYQKSARIMVKKGKDVLFDSKEEESADSLDYPVDLSLSPRTRYQWSVCVTADNQEKAAEESWFETGKMDEPWQGKWITPALDQSVQPILARTFDVHKKPVKARLYLCGLGIYEVYINGKKVGNEFLAPGYHSYDFHLQVQTYDVTDYLERGKNEIRIWLGDGWFKGRLGFDGGYTNLYGDRCYAIGELYMEQDDGTETLLCTDESWKSKASPITFSNIYDGEIYDARLEDEDNWKDVRICEPKGCGVLSDRYSLPIVKKESFQVQEVIRTPKNELVFDFGQNLTGWVEFDCDFPAGTQIKLTASEIMQDGCFYHDNLRTAKTEFTYISNGKKAHVRPHFTFYGFRYMKVECDCTVDQKDFTAYHLRSDFDQTGWIETGNQKVNQLFSNALWSQKDNFLDVPTDCPQRDERLGWTGDAQVFSETACYNMYMPAFYRKYLWDMRAEQSILGGSVPNVVPRLKQGMVAEHGSCPWADAGVIIPWNVFLHYGSRTLLQECYPGMKAWIDCERKKEEALGGPHLIKDGFHFADWLALDNEQPGPFGATDPLYIASAYYYQGAKIISQAAKMLTEGIRQEDPKICEYEKDAKEYGRLAEEILQAIQTTYFDENGCCVCKTQTGSAIAVEFGLMPEKQKEEGERLEERVRRNGSHLNTGFVGTTLLCPALTHTGHHTTAVDLLLNEEFPGWLYCVNLGATTIWERWNSVLPDGKISEEGMNSLNHYSYGSIEAWMYSDVCGIRPSRPGFREAVIEPHPDKRLKYAECTLDTAAGRYTVKWNCQNDGNVTYEVHVPFGAQARMKFPDGKSEKLTAGTYQFVR